MRAEPSQRSLRAAAAVLLPFAAVLVQRAFWPLIAPFVWFVFYPVVFLSTWLGGYLPGLLSTTVSASLVWWFFMPPARAWVKPAPGPYVTTLAFLATGYVIAHFARVLDRERQRTEAALRAQAQARLRERDDLLDRMSRVAGVGGWEFDAQTGQGSWTEEVARIHDLPPGTQPSVEMGLRYYHERDRPAVARAVEKAVAEGIPYDLEAELVTAQGRSRWVRTLGQPVFENGKVVKVQGALQDITSRKEAERALRESEARFRSLFEQAGVGVVEVEGATGRFLKVNAKFCEILRYEPGEILGMRFQDLTHPGDLARDMALVRNMVDTQGPGFEVEKRYLRKDGTILWAALTVRPVHIPGDGPLTVVSIVEDITLRKQAEDEIRRLNADLERRVQARTAELDAANRELESFAYAVSHDLRAPLRAMNGFSQALLEDCGASLPEDGKTYLEQIILASNRMGGLIDGLLLLSRTTRNDLEREDVDLSALARAHLERLGSGDPGRKVDWCVEPGIRAVGDPRMLEAALANLLDNAWKYTGRTGAPRIDVETVREEGASWVRVRDNGCGFDMTHAGKLFQPFQRLHRQDEFPGLGIGLATVERIVLRHGGRIKAQGAPGRGASFLISLPSFQEVP